MFKPFIVPISVFFIFALLFNGCTPILEFGKEKDYTSLEHQEFEALSDIRQIFEQMDGIDAALYFRKEDFTSLVNKSFEKFTQNFIHLDAPDFSKVTFGSARLDLSHQKIRSEIKFSFEVDALKRKIFGHLSADHKLQAGINAFYLNTNFNEIVLDKIEGLSSVKENSQNREIIGASVKSFMQMLNIEITNLPLAIPVDMNILSNINSKDMAFSPDYTLHSARAVNMQTKMEIYLPYVSKKGVAFFGSSKLRHVKEKTQIESLSVLRDSLNENLDLALSDSMEISLDTLQQYSSFYISKRYLSKQMNYSLKAMDLRVINKFFLKSGKDNRIQKDIYFFNKDSLPSCEGVKTECSKLLEPCEQKCEQKFGVHRCEKCDKITNPFGQVRCMSKIEACKSKEELLTYECHKRESRCDVQSNAILASCETKNSASIKICNAKTEKFQFENDEIVLAQLNLYFDLDNSYAVQRINKMIFDKELNSLEVIRDIHISVDSRIQLTLLNNDNNDINCSLEIDEALLVHSQVDQVQETKVLPLSIEIATDGKMFIKAIGKENFVSETLNNSPFETLMQTNGFNLQCTYQGMAMKPIRSEVLLNKKDIPAALNVLLGEVELEFQEEFSFEIAPVRLGTDILLYPTMESKAIGFSRQTHFN